MEEGTTVELAGAPWKDIKGYGPPGKDIACNKNVSLEDCA